MRTAASITQVARTGLQSSASDRTPDQWEFALSGTPNDDNQNTRNRVPHATVQLHSLYTPSTPDQDWYLVSTQLRHSYLVRLSAMSADYINGTDGRVDRVDATGSVLSPAGSYPAAGSALVKFDGTGADAFVRVLGIQAAGANPIYGFYTFEVFDTTLFVPRWNNSSSQITVFVLQNTTAAAVGGQIHFHDSAGSLLHSQLFSIPANGAYVLNSATIVALQGFSGTAAIANDGGWQALQGKAVAVEPATGFTFDTLAAYMER